MKKFIIYIVLILSTLALSSCETPEKGNEDLDSNFKINSENSLTVENIASYEKQMEKKYSFLKSEYIVNSIRISFGTTYECNYYFANGTVAGEKQMTTLPDEDDAKEFYNLMAEEWDDVYIFKNTVTVYTKDKDVSYFGYTLDKLVFELEKTGYEVEILFDEDEFNKKFGNKNSKTVP